MQAELAARPKAQIILCRTEAERERAQALFPALLAVYANGGDDWSLLAGRKVVAFGEQAAQEAAPHAAEVKVIDAEIPADLTKDHALQWAKQHAWLYTAPQNPAPPAQVAASAAPESAPSTDAPGEAGPDLSDLSHAEADPSRDLDPPAEWLESHQDAPVGYPHVPDAWMLQTEETDFGTPENLWGHEDTLPVMPAECFPDALAPYVTDEAGAMGCDQGMLALYCIAACAGATTDEIRLQVKASSDRWQESPRVWCMVVGDSGLTMKSPTLDAAISHAWKIERELRLAGADSIKVADMDRQVYEAQKADYIKKRAKGEPAEIPKEPEPPISERLIIGNATLEAIADVLLQQGQRGALVVADELLGFIIGGMNQYKNGKGSDRTDTLELFNGGPRAIDRKGRAVLIKNWGACIVGGTQPDAIARHGPNLEADGLLQRFMLYLPRYYVKSPDRPTDAAARRRYHEVLDNLYKLCPRPDLAPVMLSPGAALIAEEAREWIFQTVRESWLPAGLRSHLAKWPAMFFRLCLTYAAIEAADERHPCIPAAVSDHIAAQVWQMMHGTLWDHARHFYLMTMSGAGDKAALRQLGGLILAEGMKTISTRTMTQRSSIFRVSKPLEQRSIVAALCELGWLHPASGRSMVTGIPTQYRVNQVVHTRYAEIAERERRERASRSSRWAEARDKRRADA